MPWCPLKLSQWMGVKTRMGELVNQINNQIKIYQTNGRLAKSMGREEHSESDGYADPEGKIGTIFCFIER